MRKEVTWRAVDINIRCQVCGKTSHLAGEVALSDRDNHDVIIDVVECNCDEDCNTYNDYAEIVLALIDAALEDSADEEFFWEEETYDYGFDLLPREVNPNFF